jgi:hypothetical protein
VGTGRGEPARGGVTGWGIDDEILEAYTWLIQNFEDGDEIFIFGFSRGAYASDPLAQLPLKWLMDKAGALGLVFRDQVVIDTLQIAPPVTDSYREFAYGLYRFISRPFYRPVGPAPDEGTQATTARINETIDRSVFDRWRADKSYRPPNLAAWAKGKDVDPGNVVEAVRATDPKVGVA